MDKLSIIMPVFNEAKTIGSLLDQVVAQAIQLPSRELIIVESNSTDGTRQIVKDFAERFDGDSRIQVKVILQSAPRGKGYAVREGLMAATGDIILIQDGDLEYDIGDYPLLIQPILEGRARFVLGSRHLSSRSWRIRKFKTGALRATVMNLGGQLFHTFFNVLYGQRLTDPTTMFKVFERRCVERLHFSSNRFDFDFELVAKLIRAGYQPLEVAVSYSSRGFEEGKKIRMIRDPLTWVLAIVRHRFSNLYTDRKFLGEISEEPGPCGHT